MAGVSLAIASSATANRGGVPAWVIDPEVRGLNEVDRLLQCRLLDGAYTYTPTLNYARPLLSWQWKRDGAVIPGAIDPVYIPTSSDLGKALTCTVTLTGENGSASATSGSTFSRWDWDKVDGHDWTEISTSNIIQSNTATTTINLATTGGWKTSKTTGSMTAGSPTLTVADASGFSIGDQIIVATGGEAGGGVWGTLGVGGSFPTLYYANAAAMNADTSQPTNTYAWRQSDGRVYVWDGAAWTATWTSTSDPYYFSRATPKALVTTIANKVGNTLTLNANAVVNTTNANVYFDVVSKMPAYLSYFSGASDNVRLYLPVGEYACSAYYYATTLKNIYFEGDGPTSSILFSPDGCPSFQFGSSSLFGAIWRNFGIRGNHKLNSWGPVYGWLTYPRGLSFSGSPGTLFYNLRSDYTMNDSFVWGVNMMDGAMVSLYSRHVTPVRMYLQWTMNVADSADVSMVDCQIVSDYNCPGIETFRSNRINIIRFTGQNALISSNTSGGFYIKSPTQTFTENCFYNYDPTQSAQNGSASNVIIDINSNIGNTSGGDGLDLTANGGAVIDPTITCAGYMDTAYKVRNITCVVAPIMQGVMMKGGTITVPTWESGTNQIYGIASDGDGFTVAGTRFIGFSGGTDYSIFARYGDISGHGRAVGCIAENIRARVSQRNQTNAEYIAGGGV